MVCLLVEPQFLTGRTSHVIAQGTRCKGFSLPLSLAMVCFFPSIYSSEEEEAEGALVLLTREGFLLASGLRVALGAFVRLGSLVALGLLVFFVERLRVPARLLLFLLSRSRILPCKVRFWVKGKRLVRFVIGNRKPAAPRIGYQTRKRLTHLDAGRSQQQENDEKEGRDRLGGDGNHFE